MKEPQPEEHASFSCTLSTVPFFDLDALHILAADVENTVDFRIKECGSVIMGNRLYLTPRPASVQL